MTIWTQCGIHHGCIRGITVIPFWASLAKAFASLVLEGSIFASERLWCAHNAEVTWCAQILSWCCCALTTRTVILCSAFVCGCIISCSSTKATRGAIPTISKSRVPRSVGELPCRTCNRDASPGWTVVTHWTVKLVGHSRTVVTVKSLSAISLRCGHCCMRTVLTKFTRKGTI